MARKRGRVCVDKGVVSVQVYCEITIQNATLGCTFDSLESKSLAYLIVKRVKGGGVIG